MTWRRLPVAALIAALLALASPALATNIVAIVNDQPITELDLTQRISLLQAGRAQVAAADFP